MENTGVFPGNWVLAVDQDDEIGRLLLDPIDL